jgi:Uma2 family endonuclease
MAIRKVAAKRRSPTGTPERLTLAEFLALPETKPASELIDGEVVQKPLSKFAHNVAQSRLQFLLQSHPETARGWAFSEMGANLGEDHRVPDISWFSPGRLDGIKDSPSFAPELAVEIRSEGQTKASQRGKLDFYREHGSVATLLIDPGDRTIEVHDGPSAFTARDGDTVTLESVGGFEFSVNALWT